MAEVIGVRFKNMGKVYYFDPEEYELKIGDNVIVETARGVECGEVAMERKEIAEEDIVQPLKKLIRIATPDDLKKVAENAIKEKTAFDICVKKIAAHKLEMKLVNVEYTFDNSKILFYFTADGRVDFRELVKDLASVFRTRIELRQIGVRDEAKMLGGLGICGRPFCCSSFLSGFQPVSIKMAKEQGLSLNPVKISGTCGRLMCCLKYEQEAYADLLRRTPAVNSIVMTPAGKGVVVDQNIITGNLQVRLDSAPEAAPQTFHVKQVKLLRGKGAAEKKETDAEQEETEEALALEAVLDPVEEKPEKPERKERPVEKRPQREANSGERREQPPKDREKRPPQQGGKGSERRERPPKREGRPPRGQGEHAKQAGEGRPPRQERSGNERSGGAPRGAGRAERAPRSNQQREHRAAESPKAPAAEHAPSAQAGAVQPAETSE